ncbi:MAG: OmpA family protein [Saprospiraceae bacterium]|nr:OmpA family protein [Saprospiraceae bacterium]MBK7810249.1 OmpA family protein [Saprospiraceae bacterium]
MKKIIISTGFLISSLLTIAQRDTSTIYLINGSFEGFPRCCSTPDGWIDCGFKTESAPDIQPAPPPAEPLFGVTKEAYQGHTYLGMVARENDTYERVSQHLSSPMRKGRCYTFSIYLMKSPIYLSGLKGDAYSTPRPFITPIVLRIYGGDGYCHQKQLLAESIPVKDTIWKKYEFEFQPKSDMSYIELEVFYKTPALFPYNGNMLLDQASHLTIIPCPRDSVAYKNYKKQRKDTQNTRSIAGAAKKPPELQNNKDQSKTDTPTSVRTKIMKDLSAEKVKIGQVVKIEKLYFDADSTNFKSESYPALDEIYEFLQGNPKIQIEIGGHTNGQPSHFFCDKLSTSRAKAVKDYLVSKGVAEKRISFKGYGKRQPIASNDTREGRNKNQRVEVKIISI